MFKRAMLMFLTLFILPCFVQNALGDTHTRLLIHSNSTDGSTVFEDSGTTGHQITVNGDVRHETDQAKFGVTSIYFDGSGDSLTAADNDDFDFPAGTDFTIETWVYPTSVGGSLRMIVNDMDSSYGGWNFYLNTSGKIEFNSSNYGNSPWHVVTGTTLLSVDRWYHMAAVRNGTTLKLYLDGQEEVSATNNDNIVKAQQLMIGGQTGFSNRYFAGYLDELRISKGIARWTSNFTPPDAPYGGPIVAFSGDPETIEYGNSATLTWSTTNADSCVVEPDIGSIGLTGSMPVSPTASTTYTLTATGPGGSATESVHITVNNAYDVVGEFLVDGKIGIGTMTPQSELAVNGTITAKEIRVTDTGWSDFVFYDNYPLPSLSEVEAFIRENRHLPDIPSGKEIEEKGVDVSVILTKQMQKIEELTLYLIDLKKENETLKKRVTDLERRNTTMN